MAISTGVPESWNVPLFWATVDGSQAGNLTQDQPALLVGQYFPGLGSVGTAGKDVPVAVGSPSDGELLFGKGSMLDRMIKAWFKVNTTGLLFALPVGDNNSGVAATGTFTITAAATASGTINLYIAGQLVQIATASTDTLASEAAALAAAINANLDLPVSASATGGVVTLTCNWKGLTGNDITIIPNYYGLTGGEIYPAGFAATVVAMNSGTTAPSFTNAIANIQSQPFLYCGFPYTDQASELAWGTEYGFGGAGRWAFLRQQYGFCVNAMRNDYADAITHGQAINQPVLSTMIIEPQTPSPTWEYAAQYAGLAALAFADDPARPLQTLEFQGLLPAQLQYRFSAAEQNNLCNGGLAIQGVNTDGNPMILREQTQYQKNSFGQEDGAFGLLTVLATLQTLLSRMKAAITTKYPRVKLIPDGTRIGPGQAAVTPTDIKGELVSEFSIAEYDGLVANRAAFKANLVVEIDDTNPNRINVLWPPQLAGQLRTFAALAQFRLLYPPVETN